MTERRMGARRQGRGLALQALYHADHGDIVAPEALENLFRTVLDSEEAEMDIQLGQAEMKFSRRLVEGVSSERAELDELIEGASNNWRIPRMSVVDRNILRLATYELRSCPDIPPHVSVNEAVELAKRFGSEESKGFVNGLLDRIGRKLGRLGGKGGRAKSRKS